MTPTIDTILNMSPAAGLVRFTATDGAERTLPLLGFGVVVTYVNEDGSEYETHLEPVVIIEDCYPASALSLVREEFPSGTRARVEVTP